MGFGKGVRTPTLENDNTVSLVWNTGMDPLEHWKITKLPTQL